MSFDAALFTALGPLVAGRCYPTMFPQEPLPTWPALRYTRVGGTVYPDACGHGTEETDDTSYQVDVVALTHSAVDALAIQVRAALSAFAVPAVLQGPPVFVFDAETRTHRAILDFTIYSSSPATP